MSDQEKKQDDIQKEEEPVRSMDGENVEFESVAARRMRLLGIENDDKIHDTDVEIKKGNFFANLWYKRKWLIIITTFFVLVLSGLIIYCATRDEPDMKIAYNGSADITKTQLEKIDAIFSEIVPDYDKDGKVEIDWTKNKYLSEKELEDLNSNIDKDDIDGIGGNVYSQAANNDAYTQINNLITYSEYDFMLVSEGVFNEFVDGFFKVSELGIDGDYSAITYKERGIYLHKTEFAKSNPELLTIFPVDTLICIPNRMTKNIDKETDLLNNILHYTKEEE